ncbi:tetratricopeptide repeat protein [candidate division KSB1 bacterium]|nr:tetratricopeptide repeat protein [candidate division KSB1 bacterium]
MARFAFVYIFFILVLIISCAGNKQKKEERIREILESTAAYHNQKAIALIDSGKYRDAVSHLRESLTIVPWDPHTYNNLGTAFYYMDQLDSAEYMYKYAIRLRPSFALAYTNLAQIYLKNKNYKESINSVNKALEINNRLPEAYVIKAKVYEENELLNEAIELYKQQIELYPNELIYITNLGLLYYKAGLIEEAIEKYKKAILIDPGNPEIYFNLGNAYFQQCKLDEAKSVFETALELSPNSPPVLNNYGLVLINLGNYTGAINSFNHALESEPDAPILNFNLSIAFERMNDLQKSYELINQAIQKDSTIALFYIQKGNILIQSDNNKNAIDAFRKALELDENMALAYNNLGNVLLKANRADESLLAFKKSIDLFQENIEKNYFYQSSQSETALGNLLRWCSDPQKIYFEFAQIYINLGKSYLYHNQLKEAEQSFIKATQLSPELAEPYENLGIIYLEQGQKIKANNAFAQSRFNQADDYYAMDSLIVAEQLYNEALAFRPFFPAAVARLGFLYYELKNSEKAQNYFSRALKNADHDPDVFMTYADYMAKEKNWPVTIEYYLKAQQYSPNSLRLHKKMSFVYSLLGNKDSTALHNAKINYLDGKALEFAGMWEPALQKFKNAAALDTNNTKYLNRIGFIYTKKHLNQKAMDVFQKVLNNDPQNAEALLGLGTIYGDTQKYQQAIDYLTRSIAIDSLNAQTHYIIAVNYYFIEEIDKAKRHIQKAEDLGMSIKKEFMELLQNK